MWENFIPWTTILKTQSPLDDAPEYHQVPRGWLWIGQIELHYISGKCRNVVAPTHYVSNLSVAIFHIPNASHYTRLRLRFQMKHILKFDLETCNFISPIGKGCKIKQSHILTESLEILKHWRRVADLSISYRSINKIHFLYRIAMN